MEATPELVSDSSEAIPEIIAPARELTEAEWRQARRLYFTVRHDRVEACGHQFDRYNNPRTNCEYCWWAFFSSHGELVQTADKAFQEQGRRFLDKMRGVKFTRNFLKYMSTLAKLKKENDERQIEKVQSDSGVGGEVGQGIQDDGNIPTTGQEGRAEDSVDTN